MYMQIQQSPQEIAEQKRIEEEKQNKESFKSEFAKDALIDVAVDEIEGVVNLTMPLEEFQILLKLFKAIDKSINQEKGLSR